MKKIAVAAAFAFMATTAAPLAAASPVMPDGSYDAPTSYEEAMLDFAMQSQHLSADEAKAYLENQATQQNTLDSLEESGVDLDGAYYDDENELTVVAEDEEAAKAAREKGFKVRTDDGQSDLGATASKIAREFAKNANVSAVGTDLPGGRVTVTITQDAPASVRTQIQKMSPDAQIVEGPVMQAQAEVLAGQDMNILTSDGSYESCSNGFMGKQSDGNTIMLTAGHCVTSGSDVIDQDENHVGTIMNTRFVEGSESADMGLVDIDSSATPRGVVDTRGANGYVTVAGMSKNPIGSQLCKSGRTTGWTCGVITGYDTHVNYGKTSVSGLMTTTVCTEPGDSGGAYIGVGNMAQGMTSGGPVGQKCGGYNTGDASEGLSYVQPVVDAAKHYDTTLITESESGNTSSESASTE